MSPKPQDDEIPGIPLLAISKEESLVSAVDRRSDYYRQQARQHRPPKNVPQPLLTIPNQLTFLRLVLVPVLIALFFSEWKYSPVWGGIVFIIAALTDWLDGYIARQLQISTAFGAFLDPVADKIMVSTALVLLIYSPPVPLTPRMMVIPVILMICREVAMSSLREWAAKSSEAASKAVKVNSLGKWKTALQMTALSVLLVVRQPLTDAVGKWPELAPLLGLEVLLAKTAYWLLWISTALALWSLFIYMAAVWTYFLNPEPTKEH